MSEHTITQLSALSGLSVRTIRYYLAQGLIPSAGKEGPSSRYPEATLARLRLIARLRDAHLPLAEIRKQLLALSDDEAVALAGAPAEPQPAGSALDYIRSVLSGSQADLHPSQAAPALFVPPTPAGRPALARPASRAPATKPLATSRLGAPGALASAPSAPSGSLLRQIALETRSAGATSVPDAPPAPDDTTAFGQRSQWERIAITTDIELHLRRPLSRRENRLVERLLAFARQLGEEQP